jgi:hypothetical protein
VAAARRLRRTGGEPWAPPAAPRALKLHPLLPQSHSPSLRPSRPRASRSSRRSRLLALATAAAPFLAAFRRRPAASEQLLARPSPLRPPLLRTLPHAPPLPRGKALLRAPRHDAIPATARSPRRSGAFSPPSHSRAASRCSPPLPDLRASSRRFPHGRSLPLAAGGYHRRRDVVAARPRPALRPSPLLSGPNGLGPNH